MYTALHVLVQEMSASLSGRSAQLPDAVQYRTYVAQDAMTQAYGKDFAMGALVLAARFIAEKEGSATAPATVGTVHVASH